MSWRLRAPLEVNWLTARPSRRASAIVVSLEFRIALVQLLVGSEKAANLSKARALVQKAKEKGAELIVLPVGDLSQSHAAHSLCRSASIRRTVRSISLRTPKRSRGAPQPRHSKKWQKKPSLT